MIFVNESAIWAPDGTHLRQIPVSMCSLINLACNSVLNSKHDGVAVRLTRSYKLLQSVAMIDFSGLT